MAAGPPSKRRKLNSGAAEPAEASSVLLPIPRVLLGHPEGAAVQSVCATANWEYVLTSCSDGNVRVYDAFASLNQEVPRDAKRSSSLQLCGVMLAQLPYAAGREEAVIADNSRSRKTGAAAAAATSATKRKAATKATTANVCGLTVSSDGAWYLFGAEPTIKLYSLRSKPGRCLADLELDDATPALVSDLVLTADELACISGSWDRSVRVWDLNKGSCRHDGLGHSSPVTRVRRHASDMQLHLSASLDGTACVWDERKADPATVARPPSASGGILDIAMTPSDGLLFFGRHRGAIDVWELRMGRLLRSLEIDASSGPASALALSHNSKTLLSGSARGVRVWNLDDLSDLSCSSGQLWASDIVAHQSESVISSLMVSPDDSIVVSASGPRGLSGSCDSSAIVYVAAR